MRFPIKLMPENPHVNFVRMRHVAFAISAVLIMISVGLLVTRGLNLGIDFAGGILLEIRTEKSAEIAQMRALLDTPEWGEVSLQRFGDAGDILIRVETSEDTEQAELVASIKSRLQGFDAEMVFRKIDYVGPTVGRELIESGVIALIVAMSAMMLYIWFRFEWQFGLGGILALLHDAALMLGFYVISGFEFGLTSIAAILTVIGYSINDSVVIYDRIRENLRKYKKLPMPELINKSLNETLSRTVVTALTTALAALALAVVGGEVIAGFSYALLVGVIVGTYSSLFIAAPTLLYFKICRSPNTLEKAAQA
jgi:preprotein translocase SecF subunit